MSTFSPDEMTCEKSSKMIGQYAIRLGDDSLILGHRLSEWSSKAPFLEEDLALSNTALDFIGRARMFYSYAAQLQNKQAGHSSASQCTEDDFAYQRDERDFQNHLIHELPRGDFAFTMVRQLLVDLYCSDFYYQLTQSADKTLAGIAAKSIKETQYHLRRSKEWIARLGGGTDESHQRTQKALDSIWGYTAEMFELDQLEETLVQQSIAVDTSAMQNNWREQARSVFVSAGLAMPDDDWAVRGGRSGYHTENLGHLLTELQFVHRSPAWVKVVAMNANSSSLANATEAEIDGIQFRLNHRQNSDCPDLWDLLDAVCDPEIPVLSLWDLGVLKNVEFNDDTVDVTITPTYSGCPAMETMKDDIRALLLANGYQRVSIHIEISPPWSSDWLSLQGRRKLQQFGIAPPACSRANSTSLSAAMPGIVPTTSFSNHRKPGYSHAFSAQASTITCPRCASANTEVLSEFGSTSCKALHRCRDCLEAFDYFKVI